jgi:hypothetical protein
MSEPLHGGEDGRSLFESAVRSAARAEHAVALADGARAAP